MPLVLAPVFAAPAAAQERLRADVIEVNQRGTGVLGEPEDDGGPAGRWFNDYWILPVCSPTEVSIELDSEEVDPLLVVFRGVHPDRRRRVAQDDDSGGGPVGLN